MPRKDDQTGSQQGCSANTEELWGIWCVLHPRAAYTKAHLCHTPFTHTTLIAFASFITFIASLCIACSLALWKGHDGGGCVLTLLGADEQEMAVGLELRK